MDEPVKRLRILAGPNGSGKTSVYHTLLKNGHPDFGILVNADDIEYLLRTKGILSFQDYSIETGEEELKSALTTFKQNRSTRVERNDFAVVDNFLAFSNKQSLDSYFAQFLAEFLRDRMLRDGIKTITIETVMSHPSKLEVMKNARELGYRVYLYFITTIDSAINIGRVQARTEKGGHYVPEERIISRYSNALNNLYQAVKLSDRAFLIDNSGQVHELIAEYNRAINRLDIYSEEIPEWLQKYFLDKDQ